MLIGQSLHTDKPGNPPSVAHRHGGTCGCHHTTQTKAWPRTPARGPSSQWCLQTPLAEGTHWGLGTGRGLADDLRVRTKKECNNQLLKPFWRVNQAATLEMAVSLDIPWCSSHCCEEQGVKWVPEGGAEGRKSSSSGHSVVRDSWKRQTIAYPVSHCTDPVYCRIPSVSLYGLCIL